MRRFCVKEEHIDDWRVSKPRKKEYAKLYIPIIKGMNYLTVNERKMFDNVKEIGYYTIRKRKTKGSKEKNKAFTVVIMSNEGRKYVIANIDAKQWGDQKPPILYSGISFHKDDLEEVPKDVNRFVRSFKPISNEKKELNNNNNKNLSIRPPLINQKYLPRRYHPISSSSLITTLNNAPNEEFEENELEPDFFIQTFQPPENSSLTFQHQPISSFEWGQNNNNNNNSFKYNSISHPPLMNNNNSKNNVASISPQLLYTGPPQPPQMPNITEDVFFHSNNNNDPKKERLVTQRRRIRVEKRFIVQEVIGDICGDFVYNASGSRGGEGVFFREQFLRLRKRTKNKKFFSSEGQVRISITMTNGDPKPTFHLNKKVKKFRKNNKNKFPNPYPINPPPMVLNPKNRINNNNNNNNNNLRFTDTENLYNNYQQQIFNINYIHSESRIYFSVMVPFSLSKEFLGNKRLVSSILLSDQNCEKCRIDSNNFQEFKDLENGVVSFSIKIPQNSKIFGSVNIGVIFLERFSISKSNCFTISSYNNNNSNNSKKNKKRRISEIDKYKEPISSRIDEILPSEGPLESQMINIYFSLTKNDRMVHFSHEFLTTRNMFVTFGKKFASIGSYCEKTEDYYGLEFVKKVYGFEKYEKCIDTNFVLSLLCPSGDNPGLVDVSIIFGNIEQLVKKDGYKYVSYQVSRNQKSEIIFEEEENEEEEENLFGYGDILNEDGLFPSNNDYILEETDAPNDLFGATELHYHVAKGNLENVKKIVEKEGHTCFENKDLLGITPKDVALFYNQKKIVEYYGKIRKIQKMSVKKYEVIQKFNISKYKKFETQNDEVFLCGDSERLVNS